MCGSRVSASRLAAGRRAAWERWYRPRVGSQNGIGVVAYAGVGRVRRRPTSRRWSSSRSCSARRRAGAAGARGGARLSAYIGATVGEIGFLRGFWMDGSRRLAWLEDYAASFAASADLHVPQRAAARASASTTCRSRIQARRGSCSNDVSVLLPAGAIVAIVGENGAGKTTLVKLLAKMYEPSSGRIFVDDTPLARIAAGEWRARLAGAFQDFFRFEFRARHTVGLGDEPRLDDEPAVQSAVSRAGADDVVNRLKAGLDTQLGPTWPDGRGRVVRPMAEARARARIHARRAAAPDPRRAHRRARCRDRARALRAVRRGAPVPRTPPDESPSSSRTGSRPSAWPT